MEVIEKWEKLMELNGEIVTVRGKYTLVNPFPSPKKKAKVQYIVQIVMDEQEEEGPFLEAFWDLSANRSEEEMEEFQDEWVEVSGVFYFDQPMEPRAPEFASAFGGSRISKVEFIRISEMGREQPGEQDK